LTRLDPETAAAIVQQDVEAIARRASSELDGLAGRDVLLTGGAGFLGYTFVHLLAQVGTADGRAPLRLRIHENFSRGRKPWLDQLAMRPNVTLLQHDVTRPLPADAPAFDYIIHAASIASPIYYRQFPIETIDANVNGLRHLLDYARSRADEGRPIKGMLFFSTSEIYGDPSPDAIPTPETYRGFVSCTGPRACYDESKRLGETLCVNFAARHGVPVMMARPFNNYGPGLNINDRRVLPDLARNVLAGEDLVLLSDGRATRTFCYVADAVAGYLKVLVKGQPGEPYNIGTEAPEVSMRELAERVASLGSRLLGYQGKVSYQTSDDQAYLTDNPNRRCPDITKARTTLGYEPEVTLDEGLRRSLIWYRENPS
jgi:dTDP-glucose 4,6-dehydratase/UDP-glucuronate decarboxylase